jgi:hypothetical protein
MRNSSPKWRLPVKLAAWTAAAAIVFYVFPPFHIRPLASAGARTAGVPGAIDVPQFADSFWTGKLVSPAIQPVDAQPLVAAFNDDPARAVEKYGRRAGIGGKAFFLVSGQGRVVSTDRRGVRLSTEVQNGVELVLITGPVFGNALRDVTGLLKIDDFSSFDFNALGTQLNRLAETRAQPVLAGVSVGSTLSFLAAGEFDDASGERPRIKLVPIRVTLANE